MSELDMSIFKAKNYNKNNTMLILFSTIKKNQAYQRLKKE